MRKIQSYDRFHRHIRAWLDGELDCLLVLGRPGTGKSHAYKEVLGNRPYHLFSARQSPLQVYCRLHDKPDQRVVLDDISSLLVDANFIDMLKNLCETDRKVIRWGTTTAKLNGRRRSFVCTSPVLIVLNKMPEKNPHVRAVLDRCDAIEFAPTKAEVIARMRQVFPDDGALIDLIAELPVLPSLRTLIKARTWARSKHLDLLEELFDECGVPRPVSTLVDIMQNCPEAQWCQKYVENTGLTDRTYRRHKAIVAELLACRKSGDGCPNVRGHLDTRTES